MHGYKVLLVLTMCTTHTLTQTHTHTPTHWDKHQDTHLRCMLIAQHLDYRENCLKLCNVHSWLNSCFIIRDVTPHPLVQLVLSICTFGVGEFCILFHSSLTFHMHMPLISTMVWNFTLKLKSVVPSNDLERNNVDFHLFENLKWMNACTLTRNWEKETLFSFPFSPFSVDHLYTLHICECLVMPVNHNHTMATGRLGGGLHQMARAHWSLYF